MLHVFVYGSLRKGLHNHEVLSTASLIGSTTTAPGWTLYDLGFFPAAVPEGKSRIHGEVYCVDQKTLERLDELEGYPDWYQRKLITTDCGEAWIYYQEQLGQPLPVVTGGDWLTYWSKRSELLALAKNGGVSTDQGLDNSS